MSKSTVPVAFTCTHPELKNCAACPAGIAVDFWRWRCPDFGSRCHRLRLFECPGDCTICDAAANPHHECPQ